MNPSKFTEYPWSSVSMNSECETIARNLMVILKRTGDKWRLISFSEYKTERMKDGASESHVNSEKQYFDKVIGYTISESKARSFSPTWDKV